MLSFRAAAKAAGGLASARALAKPFNMQTPISLIELLRRVQAAQKIQEKYDGIGGRKSPLGRPIDPSVRVQSSGEKLFKDFHGGQIEITSGGASAFATHRTRVIFRGIHCFGKSEAEDEPYALVGVYATDARDQLVTKKFPIGRDSYEHFVENTDASESEDISLDFAPQTLAIVSTVMEHDSGAPDRVADKFEASLKKAAADAGADATDISVFTGILDDLGVPGLIADLLGVGDDHIGTQTLQIDSGELIPKRPMQKLQNISFNFDSPLLGDGDASYKLYYKVFVEEIPIPTPL